MTQTNVVLSAAGGIGGAVVRELVDRGLPVRAVSRDGSADVPEGVERLAADLATNGGATRACAGAAIVYHCAQPPYGRWAKQFPGLNAAIVEAAAARVRSSCSPTTCTCTGRSAGASPTRARRSPGARKAGCARSSPRSSWQRTQPGCWASRSGVPPTTSAPPAGEASQG